MIEKAKLYEILNAVEPNFLPRSEAARRIEAVAATHNRLLIAPTSAKLPLQGNDNLGVVEIDDDEFRRIFGVGNIDYGPLGEMANHIKPFVLVYTKTKEALSNQEVVVEQAKEQKIFPGKMDYSALSAEPLVNMDSTEPCGYKDYGLPPLAGGCNGPGTHAYGYGALISLCQGHYAAAPDPRTVYFIQSFPAVSGPVELPQRNPFARPQLVADKTSKGKEEK